MCSHLFDCLQIVPSPVSPPPFSINCSLVVFIVSIRGQEASSQQPSQSHLKSQVLLPPVDIYSQLPDCLQRTPSPVGPPPCSTNCSLVVFILSIQGQEASSQQPSQSHFKSRVLLSF